MKSTKLRKVGNSVGVILPKEVLASMNVSVGDELRISHTSQSVTLQTGDADFDAAMKAFERGRKKFRNALRELAK